jgi:hypothetical protein
MKNDGRVWSVLCVRRFLSNRKESTGRFRENADEGAGGPAGLPRERKGEGEEEGGGQGEGHRE